MLLAKSHIAGAMHPKMFARPWTVSIPLHRDPTYRIYEYACHEGNRAVEGILRGARAQEILK